MSKISELGRIRGLAVKSQDLFVTVNLEQGSNGTKNITRSELIKAIQQDQFDDIKITGGTASNIIINFSDILNTKITNSELSNSTITDSLLINPNIDLDNNISSIEDEDIFIIKSATTGSLVTFSWSDFADEFVKQNKIYVSEDGYSASEGNGSYLKPYASLDDAFDFAQDSPNPVSISVMPGNYYTNGNLPLPDNCSLIGTNGQYSTNIIMNEGFEKNNAVLVGSGCYVQGFAFVDQEIDNFDNPTVGFAIAFRPGALILRSPYIRDVSQISNYRRESIAAPLDPRNSLGGIEDLGGNDHPNPLVGRGGGVLLADRAILNQNSVFPYMLAFGATPRSPNGLGYVAKNGAGINGIGSITIFQRCAFYALNGGQITLNNSGTQFGDISMRAKGFTPVVDPYQTSVDLITSPSTADIIDDNTDSIIDDMWDYLVNEGYEVDEEFTRRDARNLIKSISFDLASGSQTSVRNFSAGFFDYKADLVFDPNGFAGTDKILINAFTDSFDFISLELQALTAVTAEQTMINGLIEDVLKETITNPQTLNFGSLIESIGHQFNLAGAGVNKNALPLNFRRVGQPLAASGSVLEEAGGRVRWSGADELNNQYFARGLKINGRTGRLEGRPFTSSVRRLARRAANSRTFT
jgi:hypothetical protein